MCLMSAFPKIVGSRLFPKLFVFVLIEHQFFILIISLHPSVSYFYLFSFSYTIVISFKCTIKKSKCWPRGAPRRRGAPCHGTNGTMVNPALATCSTRVILIISIKKRPKIKNTKRLLLGDAQKVYNLRPPSPSHPTPPLLPPNNSLEIGKIGPGFMSSKLERGARMTTSEKLSSATHSVSVSPPLSLIVSLNGA